MTEKNIKSIAHLCAPAKGPAQQQAKKEEQHGLWALAQMPGGRVGRDARRLVGWMEGLVDSQGNYAGEVFHPVTADLQNDPRLVSTLREIEVRAAVNTDRKQGLIYRKLPYATGANNSWITSAEVVMDALTENCGRARADHSAGIYHFESLNIASNLAAMMPDVDLMIDKLLADYVIDSLDHPTLERLMGNSSPSTDSQSDGTLEDDDDGEVY